MPRSRGSSRSGSPFRSRSYAQSPPRQQAPPTSHPQSTPFQRPGMGMGLGGALATGMAFGAGSEIAHQATRGMMGGHGQQAPTVIEQDTGMMNQGGYAEQQQQTIYKCGGESQKFIECLKEYSDSISFCQRYFNDLKECEKKMK